ncbi:MAG: LysR family transcriptional regulator [Betaproteobacteria bacterium HGW-Betaproteobacteria-9]|jgi:DNA-binding transcriptional LysR family regulator|nr:MAG: LysR family transcriptional regulator [Betaproteobacteria bacterium HGW-Betaproteobacteria-9]
MHIDGRRLHYFITVADTGSLGQAAQVLHVAQPALSRQIRLLEESVGVPLMTRTARGMSLTPAGRAYYDSARALLHDAGAAAARAASVGRGDVGHLRLGFSEVYAWHPEVLRALRQYRQASPGVTFSIEAMLSGEVTRRLLDGELDLALAFVPATAGDEALAAGPWLVDDYLLAVHEDSPWAAAPPQRMAQLNDSDFVLFRRDRSPHLFDSMIHHFHQRGFTPRIVQEGTTHFTVLGLVAAGLGCAVVPSSAMHHLPPGVRLLPVPDLNLRVPVSLVWRKGHLSPLITRFCALLGSAA